MTYNGSPMPWGAFWMFTGQMAVCMAAFLLVAYVLARILNQPAPNARDDDETS